MNLYNYTKYFSHLYVITKHKYFVLRECFRRGLYWQGVVHDLSKYSFVEFLSGAKYFQHGKSSIEFEKSQKDYSLAWLNHKAKNKHHWEYWIDFRCGVVFKCPIPEKYVVEMAADMIAASKTYEKNYTPEKPYLYFKTHEKEMIMHETAKRVLENFLRENGEPKI